MHMKCKEKVWGPIGHCKSEAEHEDQKSCLFLTMLFEIQRTPCYISCPAEIRLWSLYRVRSHGKSPPKSAEGPVRMQASSSSSFPVVVMTSSWESTDVAIIQSAVHSNSESTTFLVHKCLKSSYAEIIACCVIQFILHIQKCVKIVRTALFPALLCFRMSCFCIHSVIAIEFSLFF